MPCLFSRQSQLLTVLLALILTAFGAHSATAQVPKSPNEQTRIGVETPPWPPCSVFAESLTDEEWQLLRDTVRNKFVIAHTPVVDALKVELLDSRQQLAPILVPAQIGEIGGTLRVPRRFLKNVCNIIRFNISIRGISTEAINSVKDKLRNCHHMKALATNCVLEIMSSGEDFGFPVPSTIPSSDRDIALWFSARIREATFQTAVYILVHEVSHAVIRKINTPTQLKMLDEEFEADLMAQISVFDLEIKPLGILSILNAQAIIEGDGTSQSGLHPPAICRMRSAQQFFVPMLDHLSTIFNHGDRETEKNRQFLAKLNSALLPGVPLWSNNVCNAEIPTRASLVMADIEHLAKIVRLSKGDIENKNSLTDIISQISMNTQEGRRIKNMSLIDSVISWNERQSIKKLSESEANYLDSLKESIFPHLFNMDNYMKKIDPEIMTPRDLSQMITSTSLSKYIREPKGTSTNEASRRFLAMFESSFIYQRPERIIANGKLIRRIYPEGARATDTEEFPYVIWIAASAMVGNCRPASLTVSTAIAASAAFQTECANIGKSYRKLFEAGFGWVSDGQPLEDAPRQ